MAMTVEPPEVRAEDFVRTDTEYSDEVAMLISALGAQDKLTKKFVKGESCITALQRLQYILSQDDDDKRIIHNMLGELRVFRNAVVPLFNEYHTDPTIASQAVKIMARLTMPIQLSVDRYLEGIEYLQRYKEAMCEGDVLANLVDLLTEALSVAPQERSEDQTDQLELYLCLFRNVLAVPNPANNVNAKSHLEFTHDRCMLKFSEEGIMDILVVLASQSEEEVKDIVFLLLDCFHNYFRLEDGKSLTNPQNEAHGFNKLKEMLKNEKAQKAQRRHGVARSARFAGMIERRTVGGKRMLSMRQNDETMGNEAMVASKMKKHRKKTQKAERRYLNDAVRQAGLKTAEDLLESGFQPMIKRVLVDLFKMDDLSVTLDENDHTIKLSQLLMEVHRIQERVKFSNLPKPKEGEPKRDKHKWYNAAVLSDVIAHDAFNWILARIETLLANKKLKFLKDQGKYLPSAVGMYREMIRTLYCQLYYGNDDNRHNANVMLRRLFWESRPLSILGTLMRDYQANEFAVDYLGSIVVATYYMICMVEKLTGGSSMIVSKTRKKRGGKTSQVSLEGGGEGGGGMRIEGMEVDHMAEAQEPETETINVEFDFKTFLEGLASNKNISQYLYLLEHYKTNGSKLNGFILYFFGRIRKDLKLEPMFYQISAFILFDKILGDISIRSDKAFKQLRKFATSILSGFFKKAKEDATMYIELLFWKTRDVILDILEPQGRQTRKEARQAKKSGMRLASNPLGLDTGFSSGEDEFLLNKTTIKAWTPKEDDILKENWPKYKDTGCAVEVIATFLDEQAGTSRAPNQIERRLVFLKLKKPARAKETMTKQQRKKAKRIVKPKLDQIEQRVFDQVAGSSIDAGCPKERIDALDWLCDQIYKISMSKDDYPRDKVDLAIVPIEAKHFEYMEDPTVRTVMSILNFQPPNPENGTAFWRIPFVYSAEDMDKAKHLVEKGMELPARDSAQLETPDGVTPLVMDPTVPTAEKLERNPTLPPPEEKLEMNPTLPPPEEKGEAHVPTDSESEDGLDMNALDAMGAASRKRKRKKQPPMKIDPRIEAAIDKLAGKSVRINFVEESSPKRKKSRVGPAP